MSLKSQYIFQRGKHIYAKHCNTYCSQNHYFVYSKIRYFLSSLATKSFEKRFGNEKKEYSDSVKLKYLKQYTEKTFEVAGNLLIFSV